MYKKDSQKNEDDDYSCETKDENHVQCERLNEFRYTVKVSGVFVCIKR